MARSDKAQSTAQAIQQFLMEESIGSEDQRGGAAFMRAFVSRLRAAGVPISRVSYALITMHPEVLWRTVQWQAERGVSVRDQPRARLDDPFYTKSAVAVVRQSRATGRVRLVSDDLTSPLCVELRDQGNTDYVVVPLAFTNRQVSYVSFTTADAGGFDDDARRRCAVCDRREIAHVRKIDVTGLVDLGEHALKGVKAPLRVFTRRV